MSVIPAKPGIYFSPKHLWWQKLSMGPHVRGDGGRWQAPGLLPHLAALDSIKNGL